MFPISDYRHAESAARSRAHNWRIAEAHTVDHFVRVNFPVTIESPHEVGQLIDTMQEGRFEAFLREFNGLPDSDLELLVRALAASVLFQAQFLPLRTPVVPLSTMISALALYRKIRGFSPHVRRILEVGPGCGYLSFFLRQHPLLENYSQIEACESFYVLQSMVNRYLFGARFNEDIYERDRRRLFSTVSQDVDPPIEVNSEILGSPTCYHYPWWSLDRVNEKKEYFDIVTSNANLNEMSRAALSDYLSVFNKVLAPDGIFLVQCTGAHAHGDLDDLCDVLTKFRMAPVFCAVAGDVDFRIGSGERPRYFCLNNIVMVREGHPLFRQAFGRDNFRSGFMIETPWLNRMFFGPEGSQYSRSQVADLVTQRLMKLSSSGLQIPAFLD